MTPLTLRLPLRGRALTQMSPARRIPSHGTHLGGITYGIDFVPVDTHGRSAPRNPAAAFRGEMPERFVGFGAQVLAPVAGRVAAVHDGEPDHGAYRGAVPLLVYWLGQSRRLRSGVHAITGNHVAIECDRAYVFLLHLARGSLAVGVGDRVAPGEVIGACGNSGNSTEPHVHVHASDSLDWERARGVPIDFIGYRSGGAEVARGIPGEREIVESV